MTTNPIDWPAARERFAKLVNNSPEALAAFDEALAVERQARPRRARKIAAVQALGDLIYTAGGTLDWVLQGKGKAQLAT